jgi:hypothetical protein
MPTVSSALACKCDERCGLVARAGCSRAGEPDDGLGAHHRHAARAEQPGLIGLALRERMTVRMRSMRTSGRVVRQSEHCKLGCVVIFQFWVVRVPVPVPVRDQSVWQFAESFAGDEGVICDGHEDPSSAFGAASTTRSRTKLAPRSSARSICSSRLAVCDSIREISPQLRSRRRSLVSGCVD